MSKLTDTEKFIVSHLSMGMDQKDISEQMQLKGISPNTTRSIQRAIQSLKKEYGCKTMFQLAVKLCRRGIINVKPKTNE